MDRTRNFLQVSNDAEAQLIDRVIELFRLLHAKDYFEQVYKRMLARRLLDFPIRNQPESKKGVEEVFVDRFEQEMGSAFTSKMRGMIKDSCGPQENDYITCGIWPSLDDPYVSMKLTNDLAGHLHKEKAHYLSQHPGRQVTWLKTLSTCEIEAVYPATPKPRRIRFNLTLPQAAVLLLFNQRDEFSLEEIRNETNIKDKDLLFRVLKTLSSAKLSILQCDSTKKVYTFNYNLQLPQTMTTLKVLLYSQKETLAMDTRQLFRSSKEATLPTSTMSPPPIPEPDRSLMGYQLEAAIVRTLKKNKTMNEPVLRETVRSLLTWHFSEQQWQDHMASLKDREYYSQDPSSNILKYIP